MKKILIISCIFLVVTAIFFYPLFQGQIPFPGDLLVGHYFPYDSIPYGGFAPGAVPHKAQGPDVIRQLYPWKFFAIESFKHGYIPFWNPYNFSGNPLMANFQSAVFYPLNMLFFLMPFNTAWSLFIFLIPFLAALFTYLYLRTIAVDKAAGIFGGIVFAFSSYIVVWMEYGNIGHTMLWLPLGLYLIERMLKKFSAEKVLLLIGILSMSIVGGYIQGYFYIVLTLGLYIVGKMIFVKKRSMSKLLLLAISLIIPVFLTMFQFLPTLTLFSQSSRSNYSLDVIDKLLNPWWYAITVIAPDFFGHPASRNYWFYGTYIERVSYFGVIPFILALAAFAYWRKRIEVKIFGLLFVITFLLSFNILVTKYFYLIPIPVISTTVPTRILCLFVFSGAVLSAIGLHELLQRHKQKNVFIANIITLCILFAAWGVVFLGGRMFTGQEWVTQLAVSKRNLLMPTVFTGILFIALGVYSLKKNLRTMFLLVILLVTVFDLFRFFHKITPFSPEAYVYPQTPIAMYIQKHAGVNRFWGYGSAAVDTDFQMVDHTYSADGNDPLHIRVYTEFLESSKNGTIPHTLPRPDAIIAPGYGSDDLRNNQYRQKILNLLGVKYVIHKNELPDAGQKADVATFDPAIYKLAYQSGQYQIYENLHVAPRAFLTNDYRVIQKNQEVIPAFYKKDFDARKTLILETDPHLTKGQLSQQSVHIDLYQPNQVVITTHANTDALLFLSDTMYPGWIAFVDKYEQPIYTADYAFRAVRVPKGDHTVTFTYVSQSFRNGLYVSAATLVLLCCAYFVWRKKIT